MPRGARRFTIRLIVTFETLISWVLLIAGAATPIVLARIAAARVRNETMSRGSAIGMVVLSSLAVPTIFWFAILATASFVNESGGSSVWNGDAALGAVLVTVALAVWSFVCAAIFAVRIHAGSDA